MGTVCRFLIAAACRAASSKYFIMFLPSQPWDIVSLFPSLGKALHRQMLHSQVKMSTW